jgi:ribose 1,5-bisphosphokinase PhnN
MQSEESSGGPAPYGYSVVHDGADEDADPLHEMPFDRLEQARGFALSWLAGAGEAGRLAVVRLHRGTGRKDTVAIVDPASSDVLAELESLRTQG